MAESSKIVPTLTENCLWHLCLPEIPMSFEMMEVARLPRKFGSMLVLSILITLLRSALRSRAAVELENLALRHQLNVLKRSVKRRPKLTRADRLFVGRSLAHLA
jgi:hypothetical protein